MEKTFAVVSFIRLIIQILTFNNVDLENLGQGHEVQYEC